MWLTLLHKNDKKYFDLYFRHAIIGKSVTVRKQQQQVTSIYC